VRQGTEASTHTVPRGVNPLSRLRSGRVQVRFGEEVYLWALVIAEALAIGWLRTAFKRSHGG
jgi:type VI protein secretion system component VasA